MLEGYHLRENILFTPLSLWNIFHMDSLTPQVCYWWNVFGIPGLNICGFTGSWSYQEFLCVTFINAKIVSWNFFLLLTDLKMDAKVESPSSPSRCKSLYDNGPVEWKSEVYYPFHSAYNNNNKASYRIHIGIWWRNILFRVLGKNTGFSKWCWQGGLGGGWSWELGGGMECLLYTFVQITHTSVNTEFILECLTLKKFISYMFKIWVLSSSDDINIKAQLLW